MISSRPLWVMWALGGFATLLGFFSFQELVKEGVIDMVSDQQLMWLGGGAFFGLVVLFLYNLGNDKDDYRREKSEMDTGKNGKVVEALVSEAKKLIDKAEETRSEFEQLPQIGDVPEFIDMLSTRIGGLTKALAQPVGAEFQVQVVKWLSMMSEGLIKSQELKLRIGLIKEKAGLSSALGPVRMRFRLLSAVNSLKEIETLMPETMADVGFDMRPYRIAVENFTKQLFNAELNLQFADHLGIELPEGVVQPLEGMESLEPGAWYPSKALMAPAGEELEDAPDRVCSEEEEHPMDRLLADEIGDQRIFEPDEEAGAGDKDRENSEPSWPRRLAGSEYPEIVWDKDGEK